MKVQLLMNRWQVHQVKSGNLHQVCAESLPILGENTCRSMLLRHFIVSGWIFDLCHTNENSDKTVIVLLHSLRIAVL